MPKEPKLWYGIGILYDRFGSYDHAEEAFSQVMQMQPDFEKANEIYFRLGIIYKQQQKYSQSLEVRPSITPGVVRRGPNALLQCFRYIVNGPPHPLTEEDIWFQIGHVHEQQKDVSLTHPDVSRWFEALTRPSSTTPRQPINGYWTVTPTIPRFSSSLAGFTTIKATVSRVRNVRSSISRSRLLLVRTEEVSGLSKPVN